MLLYGYRNGRTLRALWALEEAGVDYDFTPVDILRGEGQSEWFLRLNPFGKVPVLIDDQLVLSESAAICEFVAERYPSAGLMPAPATPERAQCYQWISFLISEVDAVLWNIAKHRFALPEERRVPAVIETATWEFGRAVRILEQALRDKSFLAADQFSVADILAGHCLLWARSARVGFDSPVLDQYLARLTGRPAYIRATERAR